MWLHPEFFSIRTQHFGQGLVLQMTHLVVSLSLAHFVFQWARFLQESGVCGSAPQRRQKDVPQSQDNEPQPVAESPTLSQSRPGHHRAHGLISTYDLSR
mmetsp:Transcript_28387/g.43765  ORF Transcript_28387/g.43765 Transcript_28387/m.43765 type:complete len:99 (+) Transcript_28387:569-865(+)